jgi:hypothetical protein
VAGRIVPERFGELQQPAGVAHALGRLGLLEVGEELADVPELADVGGAHAPGDPTACPEKVRQDRNFVTDGFSKSSAGPPWRSTKSLTAVISSRADTGSRTRASSPEASRPATKSRRSR